MRNHSTFYLFGMFLVLLGERLIGDASSSRYILDFIGVFLVMFALFQSKRSTSKENNVAKYPLLFGSIGLVSLLLYSCTLSGTTDMLGLEGEGAHTFQVFLGVIWPLVWLSGSIPFVAIGQLLQKGHKHVNELRAKEHSLRWLSVAFALSSVVALNYIAHESNTRWNVSYFKTTEPGDSTKNIVENLTEPITIHLFFPPSSDVREEIRGYFDQLAHTNLNISYVDHAIEPELSTELKIRNNGYIAFSVGEGDEKQNKTINIGDKFDTAKRKLKKLDSLVREKLLVLSKGPQTIYVTAGHGEFYWKANQDKDKLRQISTLKKILKSNNFSVKELSLANGLSDSVPEDASMVLILGPEEEFFDAEIDVLNEYRKSGGSLLISLEPEGAELKGLLSPIDIQFDSSTYLSNAKINVPLQRVASPADVRNLVSIKYSTHASVSNLSKSSKALPSYFLGSGTLTKGKESKATATVRSMEKTFDDRNQNYVFDKENETEQIWDLGLALSTPVEEKESRVLIMADTTWLSDVVLSQSKGNQLLLNDALVWLLNDSSSAGEISDEQDVKVIHTKGSQGMIFFGTILLLPLGIFILGSAYVRNRQRKGES